MAGMMSLKEWEEQKKKRNNTPNTAATKKPAAPSSQQEDKLPSLEEWETKNKYYNNVDSWVTRANSTIKGIQDYYKSWKPKDGNQLNAYTKSIDSHIKAAEMWKSQYSDNADFLRYVDGVVKNLQSAKEYARNSHLLYGQYESEGKYNDAVEISKIFNISDADLQKKLSDKSNPIAYTTSEGEKIGWHNVKEQRDLSKLYEMTSEEIEQAQASSKSAIAYTTMSGENVTWNALLRKKKKEEQYADLSSRADWAEKSMYKSTIPSADADYNDPNLPEIDWAYELVNNPEYTSDRSDTFRSKYMTDEEREVFNYIYHTEGKDAALEWQYDLMHDLEELRTADIARKANEFASKDALHAVAAWVGARAAAPFAAVEYVGDLVDSAFTGRSVRNDVSTRNTAVDKAITDKVNWNVGEFDAFDFGYGTVTSMADSMLASVFGGELVLGLSAAASATNAALDRGMDQGSAIRTGLLAGVAEGVFEHLSIGQFKRMQAVDPKRAKDLVLNIVKSIAVNASEEGATEVANAATDMLLNGDFSDYETSIRLNVQSGMSEEKAREEANKSLALQVVESAASGALMGVGFGAVGSLVGHTRAARQAKKFYGSDAGALVQEALEIDPNNAFAQQVQQKFDKKGRLSGSDLAFLAKQNEAALVESDKAKIQQAAKERLTELGATEDVDAVANAVMKQAVGEKLSRDERKLIELNKYAPQVAEELAPIFKNFDRAQYDAEWAKTHDNRWAQQIDTDRIHSDMYSRLVEQPETAAEATEEKTDDYPEASESVAQESAEPAETASIPKKESAAEVETASGETAVTEETAVTLEEASKQYGAQAGAMVSTYNIGGGKQDVEKFDAAYKMAYNMGKSGVSLDYAMNSETTAYLTEKQREFAHVAGVAAANSEATAKDAANKAAANGKTGRKKGVVKGEGISIKDLKETFNDPQGRAYSYLSQVAEITGIDIVLYRSSTGENGKFTGAQGKYDGVNDPGTIYIDINAGLRDVDDAGKLHRYAMLRTFSHEFTHFIEKWNPVQYNEFRKVVFEEITRHGEDVHDLIELKMDDGALSYEQASREVVAEAMVDILPETHFVETLASEHKSLFNKLLEKLNEFIDNLKTYFKTIGSSYDRGAIALKEQVGDTLKYLEGIVEAFDAAATQAVETYQQTAAVDEATVSTTERVETTTETTISEEKIDTVVVEKVEEDTKADEKTAEIITETSPRGFAISDNVEYGSLEIKFSEKPSDEVIHVLKENKFKWHRVKKVWFGFADRKTITDALNGAYEAAETVSEPAAVAETPVDVTVEETTTVEETAPVSETATETDDPYSELEKAMDNLSRFEYRGFVWHVNKDVLNSGKWQGRIDEADVSVNGIYVSNARGIHYRSVLYDNRDDARDDILAVARNNKLLDERTDTTNTVEEAVNNGKESENGSDNGSVHESVRGSEETSRLLERVEPETVRAGDSGRGSVRAGSDEGTEDAGRDRRPDAAGAVSERSTGDRVGGDLQQLSGITEAETDTNVGDKSSENAETGSDPVKLREVVIDLTEKKSTTNPKGSNFVIGGSLNLPSGTKARTRANIDAIKLVKKIAAENRLATPAEQEALSKYVGWGGLPDAFGKPVTNHTTRKIEYEPVKGLETEFEELKTVLTEEEYKAARESTKNAHYTSIEVIKAMYDGLKQLGFTGGRMLEPSSGVGNFVGAMPTEMSSQVKSWTMVELDNITGMIAKYLYPNADMRIQGFEETNIPDGYMDVAIGNVPFGNYAIADKHYPKAVTDAIHNYFFAKALDKVRPGGVVMFITSAYTMNGRDNAVRKYMMQRADLMGAIRLPNTAFSGNAGTSVVTDILVLKKREPKTAYSGEAFTESNWERMSKTGWDGAYINEYFVQHPEMVLGTTKLTRGMYSANEMTVDPFTDRGSLGDQIRDAFKNIKGKMEYSAKATAEQENIRQTIAKKKSQKLQVKNGVIQAKDENGNVYKVDVDKDTADRITGMVAIRDAHTALCDALQQGAEKKTITSLRKTLNKAYDSFVDKYGYLNAAKNKKAINQFADRYAILSLENYSKEGKTVTVTKSDIFSKNTIAANRTAASAENVEEGLTISLNTSGAVDVSMIARLTAQKVESVTRQLIDQRLVFKDKNGVLVPAAQYLSGNVRAKLREMEGLVGIDADYKNNVEALREVVPPTVEYTDIYVNPGATWVPVSVYEDFVGHILNRRNFENYRTGKKDFTVEYVPETNEYKVTLNDAYAKMSAQNTQVWGESGKSFSTIFENMLNGRRTNVYMEGPDGKRVLDRVKTEAVAEKTEKLNEEFRKWLWDDEVRRDEMQALYNETYNALVTPKYSGATLTVNGLNSSYTLRDHQKDAVARIINSGGNTLLAHRVGAGKTMEMAAAAMKLKQLGVIKKPMFVVPNNVVAQWGNEFKDYFPAANILLVGDEDMTPAERMTTINKIKNNDYDAVILAYTKFEKIQMTQAWRQQFYEEQIDSIMYAINAEKEAQRGKGFTVKQLEAKRKQLEAKLKKLSDKAKDEDGAMFEDLGVDSLFVDEAHNFKNLEYTTRMNNVSGLGKTDGSQRSFDLYTKIRYLQQLNGGRGVVFATATPVMNSMTEMYIMQKYLQPDTLKQLGIDNFDSWAKMFGEVVNALEIAPSGSGYRLKQTFSKFKNVKALQQLFRSFTDVLTDVPGLKIPKMKGSKVQIVECEQGEYQKNFMAELAKRAENVKNVDPSEDNMLKITSDGRKISYSQRMIDPSLPYEETGKIYKCCENVYNVYKESSKTKGTQMIFCDMATPKGKSSAGTTESENDEFGAVDVESAQLYDDIKDRLVQMGIPAKEIAFIHDAKNDKQKEALSEKMNNGTIRVLLGSTGKMGVGLNAQKKAVAIHHLDAPWRPGDIEQRDGRVFRQKNENDEAYKFVYVTKGSFDSRLWDILERKQKFINQVMNGEDVGNEIEDTGEVTLSAAEVKAVASDNPLIMEQVALEKEISKLQSLQQAHRANVAKAEEMIGIDRRAITALETRIENLQTDLQNRKDTYSNDKAFSMQIGKQIYTDKKDAGVALMAEAKAKAVEGSYSPIGKFASFTLRVVRTPEGIKGVVAGAGNYEFKTYPLNTTHGITHLIGVVEGMDDTLRNWKRQLSEVKSDLETQKRIAAEPFDQSEKLIEKRIRYNEIMYILNPPVEQNISEDTVQEQSRAYLNDNGNGPRTAAEWSAFNRSLANQTSSLKYGETRRILINTADYVYFVEADGYMSGDIVRKIQIDGNEELLRKLWGEIKRGTYTGTETPDSMAESYERNRRRDDWDNVSARHAEETGYADDLDGTAPGSDAIGDYWENYGYSSYGEFIEALENGAMIMDEAGNLIGYEQHQQRTNSLTDREVLDAAAERIDVDQLTDAEKDALSIFKKRLAKLQDLEEQRTEQGRLYREQQFGTNVNREEAAKTLNRMHVLDAQIKKANEDVLDVEEKAVLRRVLQKARKVVEQEERAHGHELLKRYRDRRDNAANIKKYRERLRGDVNELTKWILSPDNKNVVKHVPDALKDTVIPFLSSIDFTSKQQLRGGKVTAADKTFKSQLLKLEEVMGRSTGLDDMYANYTDLPPDFMERIHAMRNTVEKLTATENAEFVVNRMTAAELKELSQIVRTLKKCIMQMNTFHVNAVFQHVHEAGDSSIGFLHAMEPAKHTGTLSDFVLWQQMRPAYAFERFGEGGEAIYDGLRRGQATLAFNTQKIKAFSETAYTAEEVRAWEKQVKTIYLGPGRVIKMKVSHIMSLYELSKRKQALGHILAGGLRIATFKDPNKPLAAPISDEGQRLTSEELSRIVEQLTPRQRAVADALQQYMQKQGGEWGNHVTLARFGERQFGEENYFPINSDGRRLPVDADKPHENAALYALLNMGFTKRVQENAQNRIVIYSIFDVFSNHMASMAQYNAFALPVIDALKWFNYRQFSIDDKGNKTLVGSVREEMDRVYGTGVEEAGSSGKKGYAQNFVVNIIKAFNGTEAQGTQYDGWGLQSLHRYNRAQVAFNFRVVAQQPLAITRAGLLVDYRSIIQGMNPATAKKNIEEMRKYSGIAAWKSLGFYDVNISRGLSSIIKHDDTALDKTMEIGMKGAEMADTLTWAGIWGACKAEVIRKQKLTPKNEGFYEAVTKLFEDVIYKTQVVDSVLTKNEFMRDKGFVARSLGSFMSEPTTTASMVVDAFDKYSMDLQRGLTKQQAWRNNGRKIGRTAYVYALSAVLLAAVQAAADALRDDDDYETFLEKWLEAFGGNLVDEAMPFNKLPILSNIYEAIVNIAAPLSNHLFGMDIYANNDQTVMGQISEYLSDFVKIVLDWVTEEKNNYTWYGGIYKLLQAVSGMSGLPMAAATREIITAWNNTIGAMAPSLKVKSYDPGDKNEIKYAYQDGYLTAEEATEALLSKELVDTENEAYWLIQSWANGEGYSRYDAVYDAVRNGGDFNAAMRELTSHGYEEKDVLSEVKSQIGKWYKTGEITNQQAESMLSKYHIVDSDDVTATVNKWSAVVVTGIDYGDIKDEFLAGSISESKAVDMIVRYGGKTKEEATETVQEWRAEKETGVAYSDLKEAFMSGEISKREIVNVYVSYGGYSLEKAENKVEVFEWQKEGFDIDDSNESIIADYHEFCEPAGINKRTYFDAYEFYKDSGEEGVPYSKTEDTMPYIDSLPLSAEQKTALARCWWADSTIEKYKLW